MRSHAPKTALDSDSIIELATLSMVKDEVPMSYYACVLQVYATIKMNGFTLTDRQVPNQLVLGLNNNFDSYISFDSYVDGCSSDSVPVQFDVESC